MHNNYGFSIPVDGKWMEFATEDEAREFIMDFEEPHEKSTPVVL